MTTLKKTDTIKGLKKKTPEELLTNASYWLDKGIQLEEEGKSKRMVTMCVNKAIAFEDAAFLSPYELSQPYYEAAVSL